MIDNILAFSTKHQIQNFFLFISSTNEELKKLSPEEQKFIVEYKSLVTNHMNTSFLNGLPNNFRSIEEANTIPKPQLNVAVFCQSNQYIGDIELDERCVWK